MRRNVKWSKTKPTVGVQKHRRCVESSSGVKAKWVVKKSQVHTKDGVSVIILFFTKLSISVSVIYLFYTGEDKVVPLSSLVLHDLSISVLWKVIHINRGYYTVARRYEFYVRVANTISHEWAQRTSEILCLPREHKIHIFEPTCNVLFIIWRQNIWNCPFLFSSRRKCREILWKPSNRTRSSFLCFRCRSFRKSLSLVHRLVKQTCLPPP